MVSFFEKQFFPYLKKHNINTVVHLGDLVDRRKYINFQVLHVLRNRIIQPMLDVGTDLHIILGNHDCYYKNTNQVNSVTELFTESPANLTIHTEPVEVTFDEKPFLFVPWISDDNYQKCMRKLRISNATVVFGHFEVAGFEMYSGVRAHEGMQRRSFANYDLVISGHFHHKSHDGNIHYLGSPYEITFNDIEDPRGFHVFDTETLKLTFVENTDRMFYRYFYNDEDKTLDDILNHDFEQYRGKYIKIIVEYKGNNFWFDRFLEELRKRSPQDISIIDYAEMGVDVDVDEAVSEAKDTISILNSFIDTSSTNDLRDPEDKRKLKNLMRRLYMESIEMDTVDGENS